jgi:hypothetical protein
VATPVRTLPSVIPASEGLRAVDGSVHAGSRGSFIGGSQIG